MSGQKELVKKEPRRVLVAGSFDPVTKGHMTLIHYAATHFEQVFAVLFVNTEKSYSFTMAERKALLEAACAPYENVVVDQFEGMQYLYAKEKGIDLVIRGYRNQRDLEYEGLVADFNRTALPGFETLLLESREEEREISSTAIRQMLREKRDVSPFVPEQTVELLSEFAENKGWN
ncbi:MAG: pantetheine-phosphate adenylyltransferase [Clostridia bacterium]|nr:pantetheine-phosphate adenylyltransferase [Clostridia bacterium]